MNVFPAAHLAVPVKAGLHHVRIFDTVQLNVPDAEIKTRTPRHQRHCDTEGVDAAVYDEAYHGNKHGYHNQENLTDFDESAGKHLLVNLVL